MLYLIQWPEIDGVISIKVVFGGKGQRTPYSGHILFDLGSDESTDWGLVMSAIWLTQQRPQSAHRQHGCSEHSDVLSRAQQIL